MSENGKKTCFVVQGFGTKTDHRTGRDLNLDDSYEIIKEAVEDAGLECIRADEIPHSGSIDQVMYEQILEADVVIADISTSNWNAAYELGVRHALRPRTTLIVAEEQFPFEFDINHTAIMTYVHGGPELGRGEAKRFHNKLKGWLQQVIENTDPDSPVYTFLKGLKPPEPSGNGGAAAPVVATEVTPAKPAVEGETTAPADTSLRALKIEALNAKDKDWITARDKFAEARDKSPKSERVYLTQQLALATYQSKDPDKATALAKAKEILSELDPHRTNDPETLGLWSAVHKRMWEANGNRADLDEAIWANEKGFYLKDDYYNGINLAFLLNARAALEDRDINDRVADFVRARWVRERIVQVTTPLADAAAGEEPHADEAKELERRERLYWMLASIWEAQYGLGNVAAAAEFRQRAGALPPPQEWMLGSTEGQLEKLQGHLDKSPIAAGAAATTGNGELTAQLEAAKRDAADAKAALQAAEQRAAEARAALAAAQADAAQLRAAAVVGGQSGAPLVPTTAPAAVVAVSDPGKSERVQFALVAAGVQFQVSGIDVEVTVKGRSDGA